ncbi:hypothetical protein VNO77_03586 [Canavalia gladiata]|uniref:Uncharacterized protein n=1 Tax=Canavalia gladiata TaxID=3824 RepID=A0AAN9R6Z1_CANGL
MERERLLWRRRQVQDALGLTGHRAWKRRKASRQDEGKENSTKRREEEASKGEFGRGSLGKLLMTILWRALFLEGMEGGYRGRIRSMSLWLAPPIVAKLGESEAYSPVDDWNSDPPRDNEKHVPIDSWSSYIIRHSHGDGPPKLPAIHASFPLVKVVITHYSLHTKADDLILSKPVPHARQSS